MPQHCSTLSRFWICRSFWATLKAYISQGGAWWCVVEVPTCLIDLQLSLPPFSCHWSAQLLRYDEITLAGNSNSAKGAHQAKFSGKPRLEILFQIRESGLEIPRLENPDCQTTFIVQKSLDMCYLCLCSPHFKRNYQKYKISKGVPPGHPNELSADRLWNYHITNQNFQRNPDSR